MATLPASGRGPRTPKLRSACDECGLAKLKCNRAQPTCSRCESHGLRCRYGVSRKMGRPRRTSMNPNSAVDSGKDSPAGSTAASVVGEAVTIPTDTPLSAPASWLPDLSLDDFDSVKLFGPPHSDVTPFEYSTISSNELFLSASEGSVTPFSVPPSRPDIANGFAQHPSENIPSQHFHSHSPGDGIGTLRAAGLLSTAFKLEEHVCVEESIRLLTSLSDAVLSTGGMHAQHGIAPESGRSVPLEHILRINRSVTDALLPLLACQCAKSPMVAMLHASSISRILNWFQRAVTASTSTNLQMDNAQIRQIQNSSEGTHDSTLIRAGGSSMDTRSCISTPSSGASHIVHAFPSQRDSGYFDNDDAETEKALRLQLLLGEVKRVGKLISRFATAQQASEPPMAEDNQGRCPDSLHRSLHAWLYSEYSRVTDIMKNTLLQLNV